MTHLEAKHRYRFYSKTALFVVFGIFAISSLRTIFELQQTFPFESIEDRLPMLPSDAEKSNSSSEFFAEFEKDISSYYSVSGSKRNALQSLHDDIVTVFIYRPGFGESRMIPIGELESLQQKQETRSNDRAMESRSESTDSLEQIGKDRTVEPDFSDLHLRSLLNFINIENWGYMKSRSTIAGFQSHFVEPSRIDTAKYRIKTLELVSLVIHKTPVVYLSDKLPDMDALRRSPTRSLIPFEERGLKELRNGRDLYLTELKDGTIRMFGAIRVVSECQKCHGGNRGDLLGAFSYELIKTVK